MHGRRLHLAATASAGIATTCGLATAGLVEWTSPDDGFFHDGANWSTGMPPTDLDTALIDVTGAEVTVFHTLGATRLDALDCSESFEITGNSSVGFDSFASFTEKLMIDTTGGVFGELPSAQLQLQGPVEFRRGEIGGGSVKSFDVLLATGAGSTTISADLFNFGTVKVETGASLAVDVGDQPVSNTGQVHVEEGATLTLSVSGGAASALVQTAGEMLVDGSIDAGVETFKMEGGTLAGGGAMTGSLVIGGDLLADPRPSPVCFLVEGSWTQIGGEVFLEFDGSNPDAEGCGDGGPAGVIGTVHDVITVTGAATLGGKLSVALAGPLDAPVDAFFDVFVAEVVVGEFDEVDVPVLAGARTFDISYQPGAVRLIVIAHPCPGDLDDSGAVEVGDLLAVLAGWGDNPGLPADIDGDTAVGVTDLLALLAAWGICPP